MIRFFISLLSFNFIFGQSIYHNPIESIDYGNSIQIEVFTDLQGSLINNYTLFYRNIDQSEYFRLELFSDDGIYFKSIIPDDFITSDYIEYYIELNTNLNFNYIPSIDPEFNPLKVKVNYEKNNVEFLNETILSDKFNILYPQPNAIIKSKELLISSSYYDLEDIDFESIKIFVNDVDFTSSAIIKEKYFILSPPSVTNGRNIIKVTMNDLSGDSFNPIIWSFTINEKEVIKNFEYSGKILHNYFNNNIQEDIISYNSTNILFFGHTEWIDFDIKIKNTTLENLFEQTKNRYNIFLRNSLINFNAGDFYPQFDNLTLNGVRVRGLGLDIHSKFFQLYLIKGQINRAVQGLESESLFISSTEEYDENDEDNSINVLTLSRDGYTFENEITAMKLGLGNINKFNLALNIVKVKDDLFSVNKVIDNSIIDLAPLTKHYDSSLFIDKNNNDFYDGDDEPYDSDSYTSILHIPPSSDFFIYEKNIIIIGLDDSGYVIKQEVWNIHVEYENLQSVLDLIFTGDVDALNYLDSQWQGDYPEDNLVIGSNMKINFNRVKINSSIGFSLYNQNIWNPIITQQELYTDNFDDCFYNRTYTEDFEDLYYWDDCRLYDNNDFLIDTSIADDLIMNAGQSIFDLPNPEDFENIFHMNSSLLPTLPFSSIINKSVNDEKITFRDFFESPEVAYNLDVRLLYPIHNINFGIKKVGISFTSLSSSYLQNDVLEKYISDRIRMFNNKIFLFLSWKSIVNGLADKLSLSNTDKYDLNLSFYPSKTLPSITFNYSTYLKESGSIISFDDDSEVDNRLNTETNNFNIYVNYSFSLFNYDHNISASFYDSEKIDLLVDKILESNNDYLSQESESNNYNISLKNILSEKWNTDIYLSNSYFNFSKIGTAYYQEQDIQTFRLGFNYKNKKIIQKIGFWIDYSKGEGTSGYSQYGTKLFLEFNVYKNLYMDLQLRNYNKNLYIDMEKVSYDNSMSKINIAYRF